MAKKRLLVLVFAAVAAGGLFAQAGESRFSIGGGITGGTVMLGFQAEGEIDIGQTGSYVIAIEVGTTDLTMFHAFVSFRNYVAGQDIGYISYGITGGISTMLFGGTFGGGIRMPLTENKKLCLDVNGKLAVGYLGYPKAFASVNILYRF